LRIKWESGVLIEHKGTRIILDPPSKNPRCRVTFITHAHADHSGAFRADNISKFSSEETMNLVAVEGVKIRGWQPLRIKEKLIMDDVEVTPHYSGHVLGSCEFEITTSEGTVLFTGDLNTRGSRTIKPADPIKCDVLILESTFGSPSFVFPPDEAVAKDMIDWASDSLKEGRIPVFRADSLGNAQEVIRIFNKDTSIPVVSHWRVSKINRVYEAYGCRMEYLDIKSEEAYDLISHRNAIIVAPKHLESMYHPDFVSALVSGWALKFKGKSFPLSDHADFPSLMEFVSECSPKIVLTCHGGGFSSILAKYIEKNLGIKSYPVNLIPTRFSLTIPIS
jgi:Cft2 family RNA processing exonuclease